MDYIDHSMDNASRRNEMAVLRGIAAIIRAQSLLLEQHFDLLKRKIEGVEDFLKLHDF